MDEQKLVIANIEDEMKRSYLDYAMSVIIGRALPDVRDGLKPVHRRILWAMHELSNTYNKPYKKSARIVGSVIGQYHPHGDSAVYDSIVRMVQDFSLRIPLIDGQGNFGCFTGDTKIKLLDGTEKSFEELAQLPPDEVFFVYSVNQNGKIVVGEGRNSRITRRNAELMEITLDTGGVIRCTPDHRFLLRDGVYKQAKDLTPEDSLMPGYFEKSPVKEGLNEYLSVYQPSTGKYEFVQNLMNDFRKKKELTQPEMELELHQSSDELFAVAQHYNHRIVSKRLLNDQADVYDITVDAHHNFLLADGVFVHNSVDGDSPAAMRYTEIRLARVAEAMLADIDKETVDFQPNYDESQWEPMVLPVRFPNLLVNGSSGIAVGMATNIPPHNLGEIIDATIHLVQKPAATVEDLMKFVQGPDFPTGAFICGRKGILQAYLTGRGSVTMRARAAIDYVGKNGGERQAIVVTELPYQVNKAKLIEKIAELITDKKIEDISDLRDESDRDGMRIVIELKRSAVAQVVLNNLYKQTQMQLNFGTINLSIVNGQPRVLNLVDTLQLFIDHRKDVVRRRTLFELRKAEARAHILEGLKKALGILDEVIALIRAAKQPKEAKEGLVQKFGFTEVQAQSILDMQLQRLTGMEQQKIVEEYTNIIKRIAELNEILANETVLKNLIIKELADVKREFANERRTQIVDEETELTIEDLIPDEEVVITITHGGYIKRTPLSSYRTQRRGGVGRRGMATKAEDVLDAMFIASTHSYMLIFTDKGQVYKVKVHEIPDAATAGRGKAIVNLVELPQGEKVAGMFPIREFAEGRYVVMVTRRGIIKKTELTEFANIRSNGIIAISIEDGDVLMGIQMSDGNKNILLSTYHGMAIHFKETDVRAMGRNAYGVIGINLRQDDYVTGVSVVDGTEHILALSELGLGKRTLVSEYPPQSRGGVGVINMKVTDRTGGVITALPVKNDDQLMVITQQGQVVRIEVEPIRETSRSAQGVKIINLSDDDRVVSASLIDMQNVEASE